MAVRAQQPGKPPTIGYLGGGGPISQRVWVDAFTQRLRELGWIEGRTVAIEYRWGEGRPERYAEIAAEFVRLKVDVDFRWRNGSSGRGQAGDIGDPDRVSDGRRPCGSGWYRHCRDRVATSRAYRIKQVTSLPSDSNSCARSCPGSVGWLLWPIRIIPAE